MRRHRAKAFCAVLCLLAGLATFGGQPIVDADEVKSQTQLSYASPQEAAQALVDALRAGDGRKLTEVLGPGSEPLASSGDPVADRAERGEFVALYDKTHHVDVLQPEKAAIFIGSQEYPVPLPLVRRGNGWIFDTGAGKEEIVNRRIGRNEHKAIEVARAFVEAQRAFSGQVRDSRHSAEYAQKFLSTAGKKDGLFWPAAAGEGDSPLAALVARAAQEGYPHPQGKWPEPYHGYYFRILKGQGKNASGGASDYVVRGRMIRGFALVAYPARYGVSGRSTYMVNQEGEVYRKDLGPETGEVAAGMQLFDPDKSWKKVGGEGGELPTVSDMNRP